MVRVDVWETYVMMCGDMCDGVWMCDDVWGHV